VDFLGKLGMKSKIPEVRPEEGIVTEKSMAKMEEVLDRRIKGVYHNISAMISSYQD
jgi:hypothetical protein